MHGEIKRKLLEKLMSEMGGERMKGHPKMGTMISIGIGPAMSDEDEMEMGEEVEMEHTDDEDEAEEIAKEHLNETPDYYSRLKAAGLADGEEGETEEEEEEDLDPRLAEIMKKKRSRMK